MMHSFSDIKRISRLSEKVNNKYNIFLENLSEARLVMEKGGIPIKDDIIDLVEGFYELNLFGMSIVANAVEEQLLLHGIDCGGRKQQKLLTWFENEVSTGALWQKRDIDSPFLFTLSRWRDFYNESVVGYVKSESFCKGGEFIFMNVDIQAVIGSKIWFRRLIKRSNNIFVDHGT